MSAGLWSRAGEMARRTPASRNRSVDFLRAASIVVVVLGHWIMAAPWTDDTGVHIEHMLAHQAWTQWLTWGFQVMPVFFFVGGYSNAISWDAALRGGRSFGEWLAGRLVRLLRPVLALVVFWAAADAVALFAGVPPAMVRVASQIALIPTWFLAVYLMVILIVPIARMSWERFGMASVWAPALVAVGLDLAYFEAELHGLGWANYFFVWGAVHQLGFAWRAGRCGAGGSALVWCLCGLAALFAMTELGPWPRSLVGVPGEEVSNTTPPHLPLLALAAFQFGGVRLAEARLARWLAGERPWTFTVLINAVIMTVFLWHSTVMMLLFGAALLVGGVGLDVLPGSGAWWATKLLWIAVFTVVLVPVVGLTSRWEQAPPVASAPPVWRQVAGAVAVGVGLAFLAYSGGVSLESGQIAVVPFALPLAGAFVTGILLDPRTRAAR